MNKILLTALLLTVSNVFMIIAWYGHLRFKELPMLLAIVISWGIAFFEYCIQVPANRIGYKQCSAYQLKIMQECITLVVFIVFIWLMLDEKMTWRYLLSFSLIVSAAIVAFA